MKLKHLKVAMAITAAVGMAGVAHAKGSAAELARLGKDLTCMGAEKAGTPSGVAEWTGKWLGAAPGMTTKVGAHPVDPYANEKPLFTITAQNVAQYADKLSDGQKAMFKKYPNTFKMNVYPSHRDFRYEDSVCKAAYKNAAEAELAENGLSVKNGHMGAAAFPFPKTGLEVLWNGVLPNRAAVDFRDTDIAIVSPNGKILWGWQQMWSYARNNDEKLRGTKYEGLSSYTRIVTLLPEREKGAMTRVLDSFTMEKEARLAWQYIPAVRRVRQAPGFGFDMPNPSSAGTLTVDDTRLFNGSGERYNWKLLGKREVYIPYNGFKLEGKAAGENKYAKLLTPNHENPEFVRWELHRVWVIEGKVKDGFRHLYPARTLYVDEDTWLFTMADNYDGQGNVWRFNWINTYYLPGPNFFNQLSAFYHDLSSGNYSAYDLAQGKERSDVVDEPNAEWAKPDFYSLDNLKVTGY